MIRTLKISEEIATSPIGGFCPYWTIIDEQVLVADTAEEIILALPPDKRVIDPVAVLEILQFNYMLGDRTLVQGIQRMPWRATLSGDGKINRHLPIPHKNIIEDPIIIARMMENLLSEEIFNFSCKRKDIYLLLTGGLDSRVLAGIIKKVEKSIPSKIHCVTWGLDDSRDVQYAKRIADWFEWEFINIPYNAELVWSNINTSAVWGGAQVSGIHLHGMEWFKNAQPEDIVLTGLFGDSIGRGEYSSKNLKKLGLRSIKNPYDLLRNDIVRYLKKKAQIDRAKAWYKDKSPYYWSKQELNMQENYLRRMLGHNWDYVRQFCHVGHIFSSEKIVSYMWSLSADCRTSDVYYYLLKNLDQRFISLPWARDGIALDGTLEKNQELTKNYHKIGEWLHHDLKPRLKEIIYSPGLQQLNVFNIPAIDELFNRFEKEQDSEFGIGENITKICAIELARRKFGLLAYNKPGNLIDPILDYFGL